VASAARTQLRNPQIQRPQTGLQRALAVAVALVDALFTALMPSGTAMLLCFRVHQSLQHQLAQSSEQVVIRMVFSQFN
tara:strand:- start:769 stop:1002 length:234 start_codon:yes stop_codon:yes gene_type:complete